MIKLKLAKRIEKVPPYLFARIEKLKQEVIARGIDVIDLGVGDPDTPTPPHIVKAMHAAIDKPANHNYPPYGGTDAFRQGVADWYKKRFAVDLDPKTEVMGLIGSKEGIAHLIFGWIDKGSVALVPDPGYPVYGTVVTLAGGTVVPMPLRLEWGFLPELNKIPPSVLKRTRLMFLNYPNNPTGAIATEEFYAKAVALAKKYKFLIVSDLAYSEVTFEGYKAPSILQVPGVKAVAVEFHTLSKTYNMTGWRIGMAVGCPDAIQALSIIKTNMDSGQFKAIQEAGIEALKTPPTETRKLHAIYGVRSNLFIDGLNNMGLNLPYSQATFYVWAPIPTGQKSEAFCQYVLEKAGVLLVPGTGYGAHGEGYFRAAMTVPADKIRKAVQRLKRTVEYK